MLRSPLKSLSGLISQLGYKHFQAKHSPILCTVPFCTNNERRHAFSTPKERLLHHNTVQRLNSCVLHTSASASQKSPKNIFQEFQKEASYVLSTVNFKEMKNAPAPIRLIGFTGLVPFVFPPLSVLLNGAFLPQIAFAQLAYGCTILAFLGGVKWGFTLPVETSDKPDWDNLKISIAWPLVAWISMLLPPFLGTLTLIGGIAGAAYYDFLNTLYPSWFKSLRIFYSAIAIGSLVLMILLRIIL